ncbi:zinc ribbon domain-containing protein [Prevotella sp. AGR2160]|uniref:zinc ribbon domain-containing protein n=1 Tax=Prevotella sp. AGR2160 TaxID=1280674 RepID=UPI0004244456|nr:zinc ribbon domain-containing protein [Prevotella sp. AGR2160]
MAIIKCPECGHQISDKAPTCPNCGVEIAGKVIRCPNCGEVYFKDEEMCPNCHYPTPGTSSATTPTELHQAPVPPSKSDAVQSKDQEGQPHPQQTAIPQQPHQQQTVEQTPRPVRRATPPVPPVPPRSGNGHGNEGVDKSGEGPQQPNKKRNHTALIVAFIIALCCVGIMFYYYHDAKDSKEEEAYEYAMQSTDPQVLQSYLDTYRDAPEAHIDSIQSHLQMLKENDQDWNNALMSGSRSALQDYLNSHPNSPHAGEARDRIDSLDWVEAKGLNTEQSYQKYLSMHPEGAHIDEANDDIKKIRSKQLQPQEKTMISGLFRRFFQSINSRDENRLTDQVEDVMSNFLGKTGATKSDVITFMDKIYKDDMTNMNWRLNNDYVIKKRSVGDEEYEYNVSFSARQDVEYTDPTKNGSTKFKINATVSPDGKISSMSMIKIIE